MSVRRRNGNEATAGQKFIRDKLRRQQRRIEMNRRRGRRYENVYRSRGRMRVRLFHMNDALVFRRLQFRKMRMDHRRSTHTSVYMEEWCINRRENQRDDRNECG